MGLPYFVCSEDTPTHSLKTWDVRKQWKKQSSPETMNIYCWYCKSYYESVHSTGYYLILVGCSSIRQIDYTSSKKFQQPPWIVPTHCFIVFPLQDLNANDNNPNLWYNIAFFHSWPRQHFATRHLRTKCPDGKFVSAFFLCRASSYRSCRSCEYWYLFRHMLLR